MVMRVIGSMVSWFWWVQGFVEVSKVEEAAGLGCLKSLLGEGL